VANFGKKGQHREKKEKLGISRKTFGYFSFSAEKQEDPVETKTEKTPRYRSDPKLTSQKRWKTNGGRYRLDGWGVRVGFTEIEMGGQRKNQRGRG